MRDPARSLTLALASARVCSVAGAWPLVVGLVWIMSALLGTCPSSRDKSATYVLSVSLEKPSSASAEGSSDASTLRVTAPLTQRIEPPSHHPDFSLTAAAR